MVQLGGLRTTDLLIHSQLLRFYTCAITVRLRACDLKARADLVSPSQNPFNCYSAGGLINAIAVRWRANFGSLG